MKILFTMFVAIVLAANALSQTVWDGTTDTGWYTNGSTSYTISTAKELAGLAYLVNNGTNFTGVTIVQEADIRLNDVNNWEQWGTTSPANIWTSIGTDTSGKEFTGTFNGSGHTISGLYINNSSINNQGLFGCVSNSGKVENVTLTASYIKAKNWIGGIVAVNYGTLANCTNGCTVEAMSYVGGVTGYNEGTLINCSNTGTITGTSSQVGGVAGVSYAILTNCCNIGTITSAASTGGVAGLIGKISSICAVTNCYNSGIVNGNADAGGIIGTISNSACTLTNCYNRGKVQGEDTSVGGIVGRSNNSILAYCYWDMKESGQAKGDGSKDTENMSGQYESMLTEQMKKNAFILSLNVNAKTYNNANPDSPKACLWYTDTESKNNGYPIFSSATDIFSVTFNYNDDETEDTTLLAENGNTLPAMPVEPIHAEYIFNSWNSELNGSGTTFSSNSIVTSDMTVYAQWSILSSIENIPTTSGLQIYPNPAVYSFALSGFEGKALLALKDLNGITILSKIIHPDEHIAINTLQPGMYLVQIGTNSFKLLVYH